MKKSYSSTSFIEKAIYYYVSMYFPDAISRHCLQLGDNKVEVDIFIPSINTAIEYDGIYWHKNKLDKDIFKNYILSINNIYLIRIRDLGLPPMPEFYGEIIETKRHTNETVTSVIRKLGLLSNIENLKNFVLTYEHLCDGLPHIYYLLYNNPIRETIRVCGLEYWDYIKNGKLKACFIPKKSRIPVWFKCPDGKNIFAPLESLYPLELCDSTECAECACRICPFLVKCANSHLTCNLSCDIIKNSVFDYIKGDLIIKKNIDMLQYLLCNCNASVEAMKYRIGGMMGCNEVNNFEHLFITTAQNGNKYFLGGRYIGTNSDLELVKKIKGVYPGIIIELRASDFDSCEHDIKALIEYIKWVVSQDEKEYYTIIDRIFYNDIFKHQLSSEMIASLRGLLLSDTKFNFSNIIDDAINEFDNA